jgi:hypothetical protein
MREGYAPDGWGEVALSPESGRLEFADNMVFFVKGREEEEEEG